MIGNEPQAGSDRKVATKSRTSGEADSPERFDLRSHTTSEGRLRELLRLFPEAVTEGGKIDFGRLKLALGDSVATGKERYGLTWPGKADCFRAIQTASLGTLLPAPKESVNWDTTENLIIEGDNLEVLKLLQKSYLGKFKMIYIDPPYNTGNDLIYPDDYAESLQTYFEYTGQVDSAGKKFSTNADTEGRFHSKWLSMMYPRLSLARNLLSTQGVILVSIDDNEVHDLRVLMNEVFGEENFVNTISWKKRSTGGQVQQGSLISQVEYIVVYARERYSLLLNKLVRSERSSVPNWRDFRKSGGQWQKEHRPNQFYPFYLDEGSQRLSLEPLGSDAVVILPRDSAGVEGFWENGRETAAQRLACGELKAKQARDGSWKITQLDIQKDDANVGTFIDIPSVQGVNELKELGIPFSNPKPVALIQTLINISSSEDDLILDFFAGSGTTAHAVIDLNNRTGSNRRFVLVQLPEMLDPDDKDQRQGVQFCDEIERPHTVSEICKERVRRVIKQLAEVRSRQRTPSNPVGFRVYKLAESNFKVWDSRPSLGPEVVQRRITEHIDHIRQGRQETDILAELLLKSGFPPTTPVHEIEIADKKAYFVADGKVSICLERNLTLEAVRSMADRRPERVVCLDDGFAGNDQLKVNAAQTFKTKGIAFQTV